jgi:hypothetical protein
MLPRRANAIVRFAMALSLCASAAPALAQDRGPFDRGSVGLELGVAPMMEIFNINEERETVIEGTTGVWGAIHDRVAVGLEFHHLWVLQDAPGAFVQGVSPLVRFRLTKGSRWNWYAEAGPGVSWSDLATPVRGTKFNYLFQAGAGVLLRKGSNGHLLVACRFFHLSNHAREGKDHNPDLEMMGPYLAWSYSF